MELEQLLGSVLTGVASAGVTVGMLKAEVRHLWAAVARLEKELDQVWTDIKTLRRS